MTSDTTCTAQSKTKTTLRGDFWCKCGKPSGPCASQNERRQPPYRTVRPDTEGQASEETVNKAVMGHSSMMPFFCGDLAMNSKLVAGALPWEALPLQPMFAADV